MRLWDFYHSCLPIDRRIILWILKNLSLRNTLSLTLKDILGRTPKVISNQNLFSKFQSWCWFWCWPLQKNRAIWLALKILGTQGFPLQLGWRGASSISQKVTKSLPIRVSLLRLNLYIIITWSWALKSKN